MSLRKKLYTNIIRTKANLPAIFITSVKNKERIRFPKEVLLVQFVGTELHQHSILKQKEQELNTEAVNKPETRDLKEELTRADALFNASLQE